MTAAPIHRTGRPKPLRLWPGVVAVALLWLLRFGVKEVVPGFAGFERAMLGSLAASAAVLVWWLFFSRAPWAERLGALALMIAALAATWQLNHESMGPVWLLGYAVPVLLLAFVAWAAVTRRMAVGKRRAAMVATIVVACGMWTLVRTEGITGDHDAQFRWRWSGSTEDRLLARSDDSPAARPADPVAADPVAPDPVAADWPGFRGPGRDGIVRGVRIATDWNASPPVELWRRPVGPGWSSFAVGGERIYTQEQRGEEELVSCYDMGTGAPLWTHGDPVRFFESNAGAGPRATPALAGGVVYTLGATGILNALDAASGAVLWSRDAADDTGAKVPDWGFSASPLVAGDLVVVAVSGRLAAYDRATGAPRWTGDARGVSYSSPHPLTIDGVAQIVLTSGAGAVGVAPADGAVLWQHPWPGFPIVQPAVIAGGDLLIAASGESGSRRLAVRRGDGSWNAEERWTSNGLKPYFNGFVVHRGHAYGFDGRILACIDLDNGERAWKGGRYGSGQLVLLADQDLLLVLSERGELALVAATPDRFEELARVPAIEGKTWNHPVLVGDRLLVRNDREMAAFELALAVDRP